MILCLGGKFLIFGVNSRIGFIMVNTIIKFRYVFVIAVSFLLINSLVFVVVGVVKSFNGYAAFVEMGFTVSETNTPGHYLLEALDFFMIALVFMIFALGLGRLFLFDQISSEQLPGWLRINNIMELKILLWETILVTLVIFCITHLARSDIHSFDILIFPGVILILSLSLFLVKWHKPKAK